MNSKFVAHDLFEIFLNECCNFNFPDYPIDRRRNSSADDGDLVDAIHPRMRPKSEVDIQFALRGQVLDQIFTNM
jgi:hypothetical protein